MWFISLTEMSGVTEVRAAELHDKAQSGRMLLYHYQRQSLEQESKKVGAMTTSEPKRISFYDKVGDTFGIQAALNDNLM